MMKSEILITGMGVISAAGAGKAASLASLGSGQRSPRRPTLFDSPLNYLAFQADSLPSEYLLEGQRTLGLAYFAADEAMADAGLGAEGSLPEGIRVGVCMGTTVASQLNDIEFYRQYRESREPSLRPVERFLGRDLAECIAGRFRLDGPLMSVVNACSSGTDAIGIAISWLRAGLCDIAIAGGADELNRVPYCGFGSLGITSREPCAPFDAGRQGLNLGEGAGVVVLETAESARRRGVASELFCAGFGAAADAYHLTAPHPEGKGLRVAIASAMAEAGVGPEAVAYINAHGTATPDNDKVEGNTLKDIFGPGVRMASTKGYTGHTLGAAGGVEAVFSALALREGWAGASAGFNEVDPAIGIAPLREKTSLDGAYAMSTSLAFGGNNAALIIGINK